MVAVGPDTSTPWLRCNLRGQVSNSEAKVVQIRQGNACIVAIITNIGTIFIANIH